MQQDVFSIKIGHKYVSSVIWPSFEYLCAHAITQAGWYIYIYIYIKFSSHADIQSDLLRLIFTFSCWAATSSGCRCSYRSKGRTSGDREVKPQSFQVGKDGSNKHRTFTKRPPLVRLLLVRCFNHGVFQKWWYLSFSLAIDRLGRLGMKECC